MDWKMSKRAIFILTYQRSKNLLTYKTLQEANCKTDIYFIVGEDDSELENYKKMYGEKIIVFSKEDTRPFVDMCDNFEKRKCVVYARNKVFEIAKRLGIESFCVLDDDYDRFKYRRVFGKILKDYKVIDVQKAIDATFDYLESTPQLDCIAWSQGGDFIGGAETFPHINGKRKIMNAFFFKTDRVIRFMGSINEDLNASVYEGQRGKVFFTINDVSINQLDTQQQAGGLTGIYLDLGTYVKSFYSVIVAPNCVKISAMGNNDLRIHHKVLWNKACPKIIREQYKKG
jgi:hypothetical protein